MERLLDISDKLNTPKAVWVALALIVSATSMNVFSIFFLYFSRDADQEPIVREVQVVRSFETSDPPEEKPSRSAAPNLQENPDASTDDDKSVPQPKRSEEAASENPPLSQADAWSGDTPEEDAYNATPPALEANPRTEPPRPPGEVSLERGTSTGSSISPAAYPKEVSPPATAPATATSYYSYSYSYSYSYW